MPVKADFVYDCLEDGCLLTPRSREAKAWVKRELPKHARRGEALFFAKDDGTIDDIINRAEWEGVLTYDRKVADMTVLDELALYKAMAPGKNFQMLAPSLKSRRNANPAS